MILLELFIGFLRVGCFAFGGAEPAHQPDSDQRSQKGGRPEGARSQNCL